MIKVINNKVFLNNKVVGRIENHSYITIRKTKEHFYRLKQGYPIDVSILEILNKLSVDTIIIEEVGVKGTRFFKTSLESYLNGDLICHEPFEMQKVVPLKNMVGEEDEQK